MLQSIRLMILRPSLGESDKTSVSTISTRYMPPLSESTMWIVVPASILLPSIESKSFLRLLNARNSLIFEYCCNMTTSLTIVFHYEWDVFVLHLSPLSLEELLLFAKSTSTDRGRGGKLGNDDDEINRQFDLSNIYTPFAMVQSRTLLFFLSRFLRKSA